MSELLASINNFQDRLKEYQVNSAFRSAADQFKQMDQMEGDLFQKNQAKQQFAQGFAQQLLGMGASPQQMQQGLQMYGPAMKLDKSQDFFSQAAQATSKQEADLLNRRGQELFNKESQMNQNQQEQLKLGWANLIGGLQGAGTQGTGGKELSSEGKAAVAKSVSGIKAIQDMKGALASGSNTFSLWGDNEYTTNEKQLLEMFSKLQTGAAISKEEEKLYRSMLPSVTDSSQIQSLKLDKLQSALTDKLLSLGMTPGDLGLIDLSKGFKESEDINRALVYAKESGVDPNILKNLVKGKEALAKKRSK